MSTFERQLQEKRSSAGNIALELNRPPSQDGPTLQPNDHPMALAPMLEDPAFQEIVGEFVAILPERISQLKTAVVGDDFTTARQLSHQLKGAGGSYGFENISLSAAKVEALCREETSYEELSPAIEQLAEECEMARCCWESLCRKNISVH